MHLPRSTFIAHFHITIRVQCLRAWPRRPRTAPLHIAGSLYQWMRRSAGIIPIPEAAFCAIVEPVIEALHRDTQPGTRPDAETLVALVYDALDRAGVEVEIGPPAAALSTHPARK